jgi:hypothetical protein
MSVSPKFCDEVADDVDEGAKVDQCSNAYRNGDSGSSAVSLEGAIVETGDVVAVALIGLNFEGLALIGDLGHFNHESLGIGEGVEDDVANGGLGGEAHLLAPS